MFDWEILIQTDTGTEDGLNHLVASPWLYQFYHAENMVNPHSLKISDRLCFIGLNSEHISLSKSVYFGMVIYACFWNSYFVPFFFPI